LPIAPDGDVPLFNAVLARMKRRGLVDEAYLAAHVDAPAGFWDALDTQGDPAAQAGLSADALDAFVDLVAATPRMVTLFSQGANQSVCGTDKGNAIINLHLATGRIGKPGMGPFSITGQPNAMGGREVGGLASTLAAHMGFSEGERDRAQRFWNSPVVAAQPGLKAVDMFRAVHDGRIKALWIMGTNPAVSMPDAGFVREAIARCPFVAVSEVMADTDTARMAHVLLPALAWGEKNGTVTNSERMISRQRPFLSPPGAARADWDILSDVARRMGHDDAFSYAGPAAVFAEYAAQTAFENDGARQLDLSDWSGLDEAGYDALEPRRWGGDRPFHDGRFSAQNGRARLVLAAPTGQSAVDPAFPLRLNTGRYRDHWHTMTRTGLSSRLSQHRREPLVDVHPADAARFGLSDGELARISTPSGESVFRVAVTDAQREGELFTPMHWTDVQSSGGRTNRLPGQAADPHSGQPGFKNSPAAIRHWPTDWYAFLVTRDAPASGGDGYWTQARLAGGWIVEMAGQGAVDVESLLPEGGRIEAFDATRGTRRIAVRDDAGRLAAALFLTRSGTLPSRDWIESQLGADEDGTGATWLAGRPAVAMPDRGPVVCVCYDVGRNTILAAIAEQNLVSVEAVGSALNAGTNCGSCRPAIAALLQAGCVLTAEAAE